MREVVTHATATLHKLHLLLVHTEDTAVRVGRVLMSDNEAVRQRRHLHIVTNAGHRSTLRNHIAEVVEKLENLALAKWVGIVTLDTSQLTSYAVVHILGRGLVDVTKRVLEGILAHPHLRGELITLEVLL